MLLKLPVAVFPRDHCQLWPLTPPSGSVRVALSGRFSTGRSVDNATVPASSRLVTLIVTDMVSSMLEDALPNGSLLSVTPMVTAYEGLLSKSMVAPDFTLTCPLPVLSVKSSLNAVRSVPLTE